MREKVAFQTNVPVTVALAYADGVQVEADSEIKSCTRRPTTASCTFLRGFERLPSGHRQWLDHGYS
jgi:hypothetical protein